LRLRISIQKIILMPVRGPLRDNSHHGQYLDEHDQQSKSSSKNPQDEVSNPSLLTDSFRGTISTKQAIALIKS
jgi:hypothetical protein